MQNTAELDGAGGKNRLGSLESKVSDADHPFWREHFDGGEQMLVAGFKQCLLLNSR